MNQALQRSTFVTVVAWIFIALSGFTTLISILQNIMVFTVFRSPEITQALQVPPPGMPPLAVFMSRHIYLFFLGFLIISAFTLASSVGLLKRLNWARMCFIAIMIIGIAWSIGGLAMQFVMFSSVQEQFPATEMQGAPNMQPFFTAIVAVSALFSIGLSALYGWIIKRLLSPAIIAEFRREP